MKIANYKDSPIHKFDNETVKGVTSRIVIGNIRAIKYKFKAAREAITPERCFLLTW
ncbi:MAG: hypothetical protein JRC87_09780 [Deltaproteobacteria bacterium]|nr:hypothetical protein [Deltaproteobacteria bacterium]